MLLPLFLFLPITWRNSEMRPPLLPDIPFLRDCQREEVENFSCPIPNIKIASCPEPGIQTFKKTNWDNKDKSAPFVYYYSSCHLCPVLICKLFWDSLSLSHIAHLSLSLPKLRSRACFPPSFSLSFSLHSHTRQKTGQCNDWLPVCHTYLYFTRIH